MSPTRRRSRRLAHVLVLALIPVAVGGLAAPASAVRATTTQGGDITIGDTSFTQSNATSIAVPAVGTSGPAAPYPSQITVARPGAILDVNVSLLSVDHTFPDDIDVMLVGPGGQQVMLMSDVGTDLDLVDVGLGFDDEAATALPDSAQITSGTFQPTNFQSPDPFAAPAPATTSNTLLSVFDGTSAVGNWQLFVVDDVGGDLGDISGGWRLTLNLATTPYPSELAVGGLSTVTDVDVTLTGFSHTYPDDVDLLLVGPGGQQATLMSDVGGSFDAVGLNLTLNDEAPANLPDSTVLSSGSFRPSNSDTLADPYPAPAPASSGAAALSVFDGSNPNGTWRLYAVDDVGTDQGTIDAWSLDIEWTEAVAPTGTVNINGGAATTNQTAVTLNLSATDPAPSTGGVTHMRFSNDGVTFSDFQPYAATAAWTLSTGDGLKTVRAQFRDAAGNVSALVSDTITLDTVAPDTVGPKATKVKPARNAKDVKTSANVKVVSSEALKAGTVSKATVFLKKKGSSKKIKAAVTYNAAKKAIKLNPKSALARNTTYKVTVKSGVTDLAGNGWDEKSKPGAQPLKWSFTTK